MKEKTELCFEISTNEEDLPSHLLEKEEVSRGEEKEISDGFKVIYPEKQPIKKSGEEEMIRIGVEVLGTVGAGVVANWLTNKLRNKNVEKILIERKRVKLDEGEIKEVIEERIEKTTEQR